MSLRSRLSTVALAALLLAGGAAAPSATAAEAPALSVASFGDSITRAATTCGGRGDCPVNSWATGSAPAVHSVATRLQELNPGRTVTSTNYAKSGSRIAGVASAVSAAAAAGARPDVVTLLIGGNDLCHPDLRAAADGYAMTPADAFAASATSALQRIRSAWPEATVLVGSVPDVASEWAAVQTGAGARTWPSAKLCRTTRGALADNVVQTGDAFTSTVAAAAERTRQYDDALASACAAEGPHCVWDGGALSRTEISPEIVSSVDSFHPNVQGQALIARVLWGPEAVPAWAARLTQGAPVSPPVPAVTGAPVPTTPTPTTTPAPRTTPSSKTTPAPKAAPAPAGARRATKTVTPARPTTPAPAATRAPASGSTPSTTTSRGLAGTKDTTAPTVRITGPVAGGSVSGNVALAAVSDDDTASLVFSSEGRRLGSAKHAANGGWTLTVSTRGFPKGEHDLVATATDRSGNTGTSAPVTVTVR
ncbi:MULTISPECIES: GDSL-type esterase/lipase family protein [unclassified Rathayibacter]|uniref:GDSL-type esterase/lipase family protein n=1 Tax=unclassified Rathayibacter TaxID=2609250 RepID=UPI001047F470|nr:MULTISPECIES: GDSL-type esterase/lipase family protein [unclassified Rathayibacter]TCL80475.1 GDSL-like lipase/acylhydrolase family protein [Rathayibacter sp. PhB192]TCM26001.1 GDSL-like lipase/acylhydrolase family protein [Rathayibacter sp. PhB179]